MVADRSREGSIVTSVAHARENLRTTREVLPREAWQVVNDLWLYVDREADRAVERRLRDRLLARVVDDSRRLDGVLMSTMTISRATPRRTMALAAPAPTLPLPTMPTFMGTSCGVKRVNR
jgi:uncharacterized alpha-E superfamily protein